MIKEKLIDYKDFIKPDKIDDFLQDIVDNYSIVKDVCEYLDSVDIEIVDKNGKKLKINIPARDIKDYLDKQITNCVG